MKSDLTILVDFPPQSPHWRGVISGATRYCREHPNVQLRHPSSDWNLIGDDQTLDGVLAIVAKPDPADPSTRYGVPVVNVSTIAFPVPFPTVTIDNLAVGRLAAQHLRAQGYRYFAYHLDSTTYFSQGRLQGLQSALSPSDPSVHIFDTNAPQLRGQPPSVLRLATIDWLKALPKPVGLFTHSDTRAATLIELCQLAGLIVPEQVGVLGVDNDELLAPGCNPPLSSVDTDSAAIGYRAIEHLVDILHGGTPNPIDRPTLIGPRGVVQRASTEPAYADDELVFRAMHYIRQNATSGIDVQHVVTATATSRRSLERHFRERLGRSPADEILRVRMEHARWLLLQSDRPLAWIARAAGYSSLRAFATAFRRESNQSPTTFRNAHRHP